MNFRPERLGKLIREQLSDIIGRELEFPGMLVTVTEVEIDKKLDGAKVLVSVYPGASAPVAMKTLDDARHKLQFQLSRKLNIKPMPELLFHLDTGPENAAQVEKAVLDSGGDLNAS
jgi:ribosome-binding factor A